MGELIDRQAAIDAIKAEQVECERPTVEQIWYTLGLGKALDVIDALPSAQPERKTGKWAREALGSTSGYGSTVMYQCSECENMSISEYRFCPNCGAEMKGEQP